MRAKLGDIVEQIRGVSYNPSDLCESSEDGVILLRANNIQNGEIVLDDVVYVSKEKIHDSQYLKQGDILICTSSGSKELVGKAAFINKDLRATFGAFCKVVRPQKGYNNYIGHFFQSSYYRHTISAVSSGANINNLRNEHISDLEIPLPPLETQRHIAAVLDKVSDLIAKRRQQLDKLDELVKARFVEMFGDPVDNPMGWEKKPIVEICEKILSGGTPSKDHEEYFKGDIPWVSPKDMKTLVINDSQDHITEDAVQNSSTKIVPENSVLMVIRSGILKHTLPVAINTVPVAINQDMKAFVIQNTTIRPEYLLYYFKQVAPDILHGVRGVTADNIDFKTFQRRVIIVPSVKLQNQFAAFVTQTEKTKAAVQQALEKLETMKKALMQEYFG